MKQYAPRIRISHEEYELIMKRRGVETKSKDEVKNKPNVLILDIETLPNKAFVWSAWKNNIGKDQWITHWYALSWAAKWLYEPEIYSGVLTPEEVKNEDDSRLMEDMWQFLDAANFVIAHNGRRFDLPKLKTRFLIHGMKPPMPYQIIDTLDVAKKEFGFLSNRLDFINDQLGIGRKLDTNFNLWKSCGEGDQEALDKMLEYNEQDVLILEETYTKFRPYIKSHPNFGLFVDADSDVCPTCGSTDLDWNGTYTTNVNKYSAFRCNNCGAIGRSRVGELNKIEHKKITLSIAR
jgi:hypothetical protein